MTYKELAFFISKMDDEQQEKDVTIYNSNIDEYYSVVGGLGLTYEDDVLDKNHPYLIFLG